MGSMPVRTLGRMGVPWPGDGLRRSGGGGAGAVAVRLRQETMRHPPMNPPDSELLRVQSLLADLHGIAWEADATSMTFTSVSEGVQEILGYDVADWLDDPGFWNDHLHPDDHDRMVGRLVRIATAGGPFDEEYRLLARDGSWVWIRDVGHAVKDDEGSPAVIRGLMVEITAEKASEQERAERQGRFQRVVENLPAIVYLESVTREDNGIGEMLYVSPQVEEILGFPPEQWIEDPSAWALQFHPDDRMRVRQEYERIERTGGPFQADYRMFTRDGDVRWFRDQAVVMRGSDGGPEYWQGVMIDTTPLKEATDQLSEAEARYRTLVEQIPAIAYIDPVDDGPTVYISPQTATILGYEPEAWYADKGLWTKLVHPDDRALMELSAARGEPHAATYRLIARDGHEVWVQDQARLVLDDEGRPVYWQGVLIDVTEQRRTQDLERDLERERAEAERLRVEDEMKTTFLQAVSHDLRTPLAAILGLAVTMERDDIEITEDETRDMARRIASNARKLDRIVSDFLDLERLNRGLAETHFEPVDLGALIREIVSNSDLVAERRLAIYVAPITVKADAVMVERIVENLLGNTLKHTPGDSRIWVRLERTDDGAMLMVEADGPGVGPGYRGRTVELCRQEARAGAGCCPEPGLGR